MKSPLIISTLSAAILLAPGISSANRDDSKYPAANFQPKVIYLDKSAVQAQGSSATSFTGEKSVYGPKYPAANFEPKVIYP
ncbi:hypothetical protein BPLS_P3086 [Bathymodiolus platifrons methanotrophic gill symbiont]|uniref:hypothetical protein n=1 Tax=Bathymodiolus platifrons methanotrophic gill symbiont TaxID=113268 RepID=UPI0011CB7CF3|nr:hypothetical protein [Bathymodiolus platifrons methanotrophic gill symbiont]TXK97738.1 hypothetical protein BMR02_09820 [Methylococcaceae bacterium HT1]TXL13358.1 hypothetical protein BMR04_14405 [Methylococcaceae bacterium HT3]TXL22296.1 hypothetical protein BMR03_09055 [Methylococcaceae bacterium HT2]TXK97740.1 hypothetical protein BMR02_09830 [Methylococcaceae bacterium HT1]TXL15792.1 hypothetical protein BMR04_11105 [Methylococcaceae bacterium HT3]